MESSSDIALFTPLKIGGLSLSHRIVMAPLTRNRAHEDGMHSEVSVLPDESRNVFGLILLQMAIEYYTQRASAGGLIISEATFISEEAGGYRLVSIRWEGIF